MFEEVIATTTVINENHYRYCNSKIRKGVRIKNSDATGMYDIMKMNNENKNNDNE